jgi:hypothetical protein
MSYDVLSYQLLVEQLSQSLCHVIIVKDNGRLVPDWHQDVEKPLTCSMRPHFVERLSSRGRIQREKERRTVLRQTQQCFTISCDISSASSLLSPGSAKIRSLRVSPGSQA